MFDTLTPDQEELIEQLARLQRIDSGPDMNSGPDAAEAAIERLYGNLGLRAPAVVWCEGPFQLAVMPILLQLLVFRMNDQMREQLSLKFGAGKVNGREAELVNVLKQPRWKEALERLLEQVPTPIICELESTDELKVPALSDDYFVFGWSRCGVSTADPLCKLMRASIDDAVKCLSQSATLKMATELLSRLYTIPVNHMVRAKETVSHVLERDEAVRLRDAPNTIFGSARGPMTGIYRIANELHSQIGGTIFEEILAACPAPQAASRYRRPRHLENDLTVNTAGILAFGPYDTLWGSWGGLAVTSYAIISGMFRDRFPKELRTTLSDLSTFLRSGFAYTPLTRTFFICKFPEVHVDEQLRLHCDNGPAIEFLDRFRIYALRGVPVVDSIVEFPHLLTVNQIDDERNVELRRVLIDRYGISSYLKDSGAGIMDRSDAGVLYLKQLPGDEPIAIVQVKNSTPESDGSFKDYFLRVPPSVRTVQEAIAWTFGMAADEYNPTAET
jgi:hypothetical protein